MMSDDTKYNGEHYRDKTAYDAIYKAEPPEREDLARLKAAIGEAKKAFRRNGFDVIERIILIDRQSGKVYR